MVTKTNNNTLSKEYTAEEQTNISTMFSELNATFDLGISLSAKSRKDLQTVAKERRPFVQLALQTTKNYPEVLSRKFNEVEFEKDVNLLNFLHGVLLKIDDFKKRVEDIYMVAGNESYASALRVKDFLKANHKDNPEYKSILDQMDAFFKKSKSKKTEPEAENGTE